MAEHNGITTQGASQVKLAPSCARISFSVEESSASSSGAALAMLQKKRAAIRALASPVALIEQDQEATRPVYAYATGQPARIVRYRATVSFTFLLTHLDVVQEFTEAVLRAGVTTIEEVAYDATEDEWLTARLEALEKATKYAFIKATKIARTLAPEIDNLHVLSVDEHDGGYSHHSPVTRAYAFSEMAAQSVGGSRGIVDVTPGLLTVDARVTMLTRMGNEH
jgi:uncharacterized protein YggE